MKRGPINVPSAGCIPPASLLHHVRELRLPQDSFPPLEAETQTALLFPPFSTTTTRPTPPVSCAAPSHLGVAVDTSHLTRSTSRIHVESCLADATTFCPPVPEVTEPDDTIARPPAHDGMHLLTDSPYSRVPQPPFSA